MQFKAQNKHIQTEQGRISKRKAIVSLLETEKDTEEQLRAFRKQISRFTELDIGDEQVLKQVLQRLIQKIEVIMKTVQSKPYFTTYPVLNP